MLKTRTLAGRQKRVPDTAGALPAKLLRNRKMLEQLTTEQQAILVDLVRRRENRKGRKRQPEAEAVKYLSEEQVTAFFAAIEKLDLASRVRDRAMFRVMYHRGLRASEAGLILLGDFDPAAGTLKVTRKKGSLSGRYRCVEVEAKAVRAWIKQRGQAAGPLFPSRNHRPIDRSTVGKLYLRYAAAAGIPRDQKAGKHGRSVHSLKHSCGTHVLARVNDLVKVQDHLGHRSIQSTEIYAKVLGKTRDQVADQLRDWK